MCGERGRKIWSRHLGGDAEQAVGEIGNVDVNFGVIRL